MGWRYFCFRILREFSQKSGLLKRNFPTNLPAVTLFSLSDWKKSEPKFFLGPRESLPRPTVQDPQLKKEFDNIANGRYLFFNSTYFDLGLHYDWITNPENNYRYDISKHWTEIPDISEAAGDIKFVWEKSRFSYLGTIIRYDHQYNTDCAESVFNDILSWIDANPINCGPNYRCSQEISLRIFNWTFALHYYKNSPFLTEVVFDKILKAIYWQTVHVRKNIWFSRIAVRNNHAITETLCLYLVGMLYPALPGAAEWKKKGKSWFEAEIEYQVYQDGTFLQFSMNYHRVVIQLLTWAIILAERNNEKLSPEVYKRANASVHFLRTCMDDATGWLPNYGNNDGALFFSLNSNHFRDYRPQLQALSYALGYASIENFEPEDAFWYGLSHQVTQKLPTNGAHLFENGGYYIIRELDTITFIRCANYKDRPLQADNLHLDIWYKGENLLLDAGSYKYNTDAATFGYFMGTASHNTIVIANHDQMLRGNRFIWYFWTQKIHASLIETKTSFVFDGEISAFRQINKRIRHRRSFTKIMDKPEWVVTDEILHLPPGLKITQLWHTLNQSKFRLKFASVDATGELIPVQSRSGWYSALYGKKETAVEYYLCPSSSYIQTTISVEEKNDAKTPS